MTKRALKVLATVIGLLGCGGTPVTGTDAGADAFTPSDGAPAVDGGVVAQGWREGPDFPEPVAFGSAMVLPSDGTDYLYVIGGAAGRFGALTDFHAQIRRAPIQSDHSLGAWESAGQIGTAASPLALAGHGAIRIWAETGEDGVAIAGGGTATSALPAVLGGYVQFDGSLGAWGQFMPRLTTGQSFGTFNAFEAHQLALIGGLESATPTARVMIAAIENGSMSPTWREGVPLPEARFGHGAVLVEGEVYVIGGASVDEADGALSSIVRTARDEDMNVDAWVSAGTLADPVTFPGVALIEDGIVVIGGVEGDPSDGVASARVRSATVDAATHQVGAFSDVAGATLPEAMGAPMIAVDGAYVYAVGGLSGADLTASTSVFVGRL